MTVRILIVDDRGELRRLVKMTLAPGNYELLEADSSASALHMLNTVKPELVVLDVMLPGNMNGFHICDIIKQQADTKNTKVVMLSAKGQLADLEKGRLTGADAYLVKPFSPMKLMTTVEQLLFG